MKHLVLAALILLLLSACSSESGEDPTAESTDIAAVSPADRAAATTASITADSEEPLGSSLEQPPTVTRTRSPSRPQSDAIPTPEAGDIEDNVESNKAESENQPTPESTATRMTEDGPVAPSGSVNLVDLPRTPADPGESGQLVVMPAPGEPDQKAKTEEEAKQDLVKRLEVNLDDITTVSAELVEWSDSSLGCPSRGMLYLQVMTPGYLITLEVAGKQFEYHTDMNDHFVLCQDGRPLD